MIFRVFTWIAPFEGPDWFATPYMLVGCQPDIGGPTCYMLVGCKADVWVRGYVTFGRGTGS